MPTKPLRGAPGAHATLEGVVAIVPVAQGSHSEHLGPVLQTDAGDARVYVLGDNPFENASLRVLVGERVRLEGVWRNGVMRVEPGALVRLDTGATPGDDVPASAAREANLPEEDPS